MSHLTPHLSCLFAFLILWSVSANGQTPNPAIGLPEAIRAERDAFQPISDAQLNTRRAQLTAALDRLQRYLAPGGANGQNWARFLRTAELQSEIAKGREADIAVLEEIQPLYNSGYLGLERPVFSDVGKSLRRYLDSLSVAADEEAREHYQARVDALAEGVEQYIQNPSGANTYYMGAVLGEIGASGQMPRLLPRVRRRLSFPNLFVDARERLVAAGINDVVNDVGPLSDVILGTRIYGTTHTVGQVNADLEPSPNYAAIDVLMTGTAYSRNTGYNGPAIIHSSGVTGLGGRKRLILDEHGLRSLPAASNARTQSTIHGVDVSARHFRGLIDRIATKRVYESKSRAEAIGSQRAQTRLNRRMDSQSSTMVANANRDFWHNFRYRLARFSAFPEVLRFSTTHDRLLIRATRADNYQLGAPTAPPDMPADTDIQVRLHESALNNFAFTILAGRVMNSKEIRNLAVNLTGKVPEIEDDEESRRWAMEFGYNFRPVEFRLHNGGLELSVNTENFILDDTPYRQVVIRTKYKLDMGPKGLVAVRDGDLDVFRRDPDNPDDPTKFQQLAAREAVVARFIRRQFGDKVLKERLPDEENEQKRPTGLELPGRWKSLGPLPLVYWRSEHGWLSLGWNQAQPVPGPVPAPGVGPALIHPASIQR
jgi:hypothetical protein